MTTKVGLDFLVSFVYKRSTENTASLYAILLVCIRYSMRELLSETSITMPDPRTSDMYQLGLR